MKDDNFELETWRAMCAQHECLYDIMNATRSGYREPLTDSRNALENMRLHLIEDGFDRSYLHSIYPDPNYGDK